MDPVLSAWMPAFIGMALLALAGAVVKRLSHRDKRPHRLAH